MDCKLKDNHDERVEGESRSCGTIESYWVYLDKETAL